MIGRLGGPEVRHDTAPQFLHQNACFKFQLNNCPPHDHSPKLLVEDLTWCFILTDLLPPWPPLMTICCLDGDWTITVRPSDVVRIVLVGLLGRIFTLPPVVAFCGMSPSCWAWLSVIVVLMGLCPPVAEVVTIRTFGSGGGVACCKAINSMVTNAFFSADICSLVKEIVNKLTLHLLGWFPGVRMSVWLVHGHSNLLAKKKC